MRTLPFLSSATWIGLIGIAGVSVLHCPVRLGWAVARGTTPDKMSSESSVRLKQQERMQFIAESPRGNPTSDAASLCYFVKGKGRDIRGDELLEHLLSQSTSEGWGIRTQLGIPLLTPERHSG